MQKNNLKPPTIALVGVVFWIINFIFDGILPDLLGVLGIVLIVVGAAGIFINRKSKDTQNHV